jgi:hypothetical protein
VHRSQPIISPALTIIIGINFRFNLINNGADWIGIAHSIDEPIMIDIVDIATIGVAVESFSLELNNGR